MIQEENTAVVVEESARISEELIDQFARFLLPLMQADLEKKKN